RRGRSPCPCGHRRAVREHYRRLPRRVDGSESPPVHESSIDSLSPRARTHRLSAETRARRLPASVSGSQPERRFGARFGRGAETATTTSAVAGAAATLPLPGPPLRGFDYVRLGPPSPLPIGREGRPPPRRPPPAGSRTPAVP